MQEPFDTDEALALGGVAVPKAAPTPSSRLAALRSAISILDMLIIFCMGARLRIARRIGKEKRELRAPVCDRQREALVFARVRRWAGAAGGSCLIRPAEDIYKILVEAGKAVQGSDIVRDKEKL